MNGKAFLSLVRIPTVFSSMSNAYAGYMIGCAASGNLPTFSAAAAPIAPIAGILAAGLFIMAGMALNDVADKDVDARERPGRPIPSGAITLRGAWALSLGMMSAGLILLSVLHPLSSLPAGALCLAIFAYNFLLKGTALGPAAMGLCRMLNLATGISLAWNAWPAPESLPKPLWFALFSLWGYIAIVTYLARDEVGGNTKKRAYLFMLGTAVWFIGWSVAALAWFHAGNLLALAWLGLAILLRVPLRNLASDPSPKHTGQMVGMMLRLVPLVDVLAMLANQVPPVQALCGALWVLPAYAVGKWFYST